MNLVCLYYEMAFTPMMEAGWLFISLHQYLINYKERHGSLITHRENDVVVERMT